MDENISWCKKCRSPPHHFLNPKKWIKRFEFYFVVAGLQEKQSEDVLVNLKLKGEESKDLIWV